MPTKSNRYGERPSAADEPRRTSGTGGRQQAAAADRLGREAAAAAGRRRRTTATDRPRVWTSDSTFAKIVRLCNVRERTTSELEQRLQRDGIPDGLAEAAIERAVNCGLVDEVRFTEAFLRGKIASGWGRRRIERELARFGVNEDALERFLEDCPQNYFSEESELERAIVQLNRFHSTARNISDARYRRLAQKGYDSEVIRQALASYTDSCSPSS